MYTRELLKDILYEYNGTKEGSDGRPACRGPCQGEMAGRDVALDRRREVSSAVMLILKSWRRRQAPAHARSPQGSASRETHPISVTSRSAPTSHRANTGFGIVRMVSCGSLPCRISFTSSSPIGRCTLVVLSSERKSSARVSLGYPSRMHSATGRSITVSSPRCVFRFQAHEPVPARPSPSLSQFAFHPPLAVR